MENQILEHDKAPAKKNTFINVLTILTLIACAWTLYQAVDGYINADKNIAKMQDGMTKLEEAGMENSWSYRMMEKGIVMTEKQKENGLLLLIVNILGLSLCAYGAIEMRKLRKNGFYSWLAGEFLPIIVGIVIFGFSMFGGFMAIMMIVPIAFAIMYGSQLKHMS